jgi:outer membrane protein OmpA-like peptidoglycan-associated protein
MCMRIKREKRIVNLSIVFILIHCALSLKVVFSSAFLEDRWYVRPLGMGGAFVGLSDGPEGVLFNPAGIVEVKDMELTAMGGKPYLGMENINIFHSGIAAVYPSKELSGTIGAGGTYLTLSDLYSEVVAAISYASRISISESMTSFLGGSIKYLSHSYKWDPYTKELGVERGDPLVRSGGTLSAGGVGVDIGLLLKWGIYSVGVVGRNITQPNVGVKSEDRVPMEIIGGVSAPLSFLERTTVCSDIKYTIRPFNPITFRIGVENWNKKKTLALRAGYDSSAGPTAGISYVMKAGENLFLRIDYGLLWPVHVQGHTGTHRAGITLSWQVPPSVVSLPPVDITPSPGYISPNGDTMNDSTELILSFSSDIEVAKWEINILNEKGEVVKNFVSGKGVKKLPQRVSWNGKNNLNKTLPDGKYTCYLELEDANGKKYKSPSKSIVIDTVPPKVDISLSQNKFTPDGDGVDDTVKINLEAKDDVDIEKWIIKITDTNNKLVKTFQGAGKPPSSIVWDGKDDYYERVVVNGAYSIKATVYDLAGNKSSANTSVEVYIGQPTVVKEVVREVIKEVPKEIVVKEEGNKLKLNLSSSLLFKFGKAELEPSAYPVLEQVVGILNAYPNSKIVIEGHTDSIGDDSFNMLLSELRARRVYEFLIKRGIDAKRMSYKGYGETRPIASNKTETGRALNRRVEIIILRE